MAKQIIFTYEGKDYTLEYTRRTVQQMEAEGFVGEDVEKRPMTLLPALFAGAFKAHHRFVKQEVIDKIFAAMPDAESERVAAETARVQAETKRQQDTSKAITDCNTATDSALKAAATMMIVNDDTGKTYQGAIKVIGGKPVFEYDEVVTG